MIVDCHTHIPCPASETDAAEHIEACSDVDACFVLAANSDDSKTANKQLSEYIAKQEKMIGFAAVNPVEDKIGIRTITSLSKDLDLKGSVLYCSQNNFHPAHSRAMRFYQAAQELNMPVFFHNSTPTTPDSIMDFAQPCLIDEVAREFPALKIIIGGMGLPFVSQTFCMLAKHENVYADLTISPKKPWEVYNIVVNAYEADVMDKLLFGSGYPKTHPGLCIETLLGFNRLLGNTNLPTVPREKLRSVIERDTLTILGITP